MTRFSFSFWCATLFMSAALVGCSPSSDGGGGNGGGGNGGGGNGGGGGGSGGTGGGGGAGGGSSAADPLEIIPVDNTVEGWIVDQNSTKPGVRAMTGASLKEVESLIDGGATPFFSVYTPKLFMWQNYINTTLPSAPEDGATMMLYAMQMPSVDDASGLYTSVLKTSDYTRKVGTPDDWKDVSGKWDAARIQDTGTSWWVNFRKGVYYAEVLLAPSYGPPPDYTIGDPNLKQAALDFATAIAERIH